MARPEAAVRVPALWGGARRRAASQGGQFEHIQSCFLTDGLGLTLNTPGISNASGHTGTNEPHKGTSILMRASQYRCGSDLRSSGEQLGEVR